MHGWTERPLAAPAFQIEAIRRQKRLNINPKIVVSSGQRMVPSEDQSREDKT